MGSGQWGMSGASVLQDVEIAIREAAVVNTKKIYLVDVADIEAPFLLKEGLEAICLGYSPRLGEVKIFDGNRLKARVTSGSSFSGNLVISVPETVLIKRESQEISKEEIQGVFHDYVAGKTGEKEFSIRELTCRGPALFPGGNLSMALSSNSADVKGRVTLYVDIAVNDEACGRMSVSGWVDVFDELLCASRYLERGTVLSPGDLRSDRINISRIRDNYLNSTASVLGKALRNGVREGGRIRENMLEEPSLVKKGEVVQLIAMAGNLEIVTTGIARGDGKMNEQIRVSNINSKVIVHGVVTGRTKVKVLY